MDKGMPCELVGWDEVQCLARDLALRLRADGFEPDIIVALGRGGWIPGRLLSDNLSNLNLTEFKVEHYRGTRKQAVASIRYPLKADVTGQRVLLVDDVTDSGDSIVAALEHIHSRGQPTELRTMVLHHKTSSPYVPDYFAQEITEWRWIIYPWAVVEDLTALIKGMDGAPPRAEELAERLMRDHRIRVPSEMVRDVLNLMKA